MAQSTEEPFVGHVAHNGGSLLERGALKAAVLDALQAARDGQGGALFVVGTAGLGKTSVLKWAEAAARTAGCRVAPAVGSLAEARLPYGLFGQAMVALGGSAVDDAAELARLGGQPARLYRALRFLLGIAEGAPLVLTLDDLHWADADSLELLGFVCRRLAGARVLVLGALRPEPDRASVLAAELVGSGHASTLELDPLSPEAARELLSELSPLAHSERERLVESCAGSPLLLKVACSALSGDGSMPSLWLKGEFGRSLLLERFVGLGSEAFGYLRGAAVLGVRFRPVLAGRLGGLDDSACQDAHRRLVRSGLIDDLGASWAAFVHPLFAQVLVDDLTPSERERLHADAFRLLVEHGEPDAVAAPHASAGRLHGDPLAVETAARAGRQALAQGALETACGLLGGALELAGAAASLELQLDYATALSTRGRFEEALAICKQLAAADDATVAIRCNALTLMARIAIFQGEPETGQRLYERAAAAAAEDPELQAQTLVDAVFICRFTSPMHWVLSITERALELTGRNSPMLRSLQTLKAYGRLMTADAEEAELLAREAGEWLDASRRGEHSREWTLPVHMLVSFKLLEDLDGATAVFEREFPEAVEAGAPLLIYALAIAYADAAFRVGRLREALELVETAASVSDMRMTPWYEMMMAAFLTELGREEEATPYLDVLRRIKASTGAEFYAPARLWFDLIEARRLLACGRAKEASDLMLDAAEVAERSSWREPCIVPWASTGLEAHLAAGRPDRACALLAYLERISAPLPCRWPRAVVELGRAGVAAAEGTATDAERHFQRALAILDELPLVLTRAEALIGYGKFLRRSGHPTRAREPLARALELAERAGSERLARLARAELAASGGRRRRREDDRLTPQEERVAALATDGLSNVQIAAALTVSAKTVDNHLQRIYAKLGIHSRRELMRRARESA